MAESTTNGAVIWLLRAALIIVFAALTFAVSGKALAEDTPAMPWITGGAYVIAATPSKTQYFNVQISFYRRTEATNSSLRMCP